MNTKFLLGAALAAAITFSSCDNGLIYGPNTVTIGATITPWASRFDSVVIDVRQGGFRGPLYEANHDPMHNPFQTLIYVDNIPQGDWALAAVYYKTYWKKTSATDSVITGTGHRVAVAMGSVKAVYDQECDCRYLEGDDVDLRLAD